jgi:ubiquinone/menaquinone biosynthesis C-methylase UbiE
MTIWGLWVVLLMASAAFVLAWYLLVTTEGVYLGRKVVIWLYDRYAARYDRIKKFRADWDDESLAQPLLRLLALQKVSTPLLLDVATGTIRLPLALFSAEEPVFNGVAFGLDYSRKMLAQAAQKIPALARARLALIYGPAEAIPFADDLFDVVTCLEALEFMANPAQALAELARVLRPGGIMLISNRKGINARLLPGKAVSAAQIRLRLQQLGMVAIRVEIWQIEYELVWAIKGSQGPASQTESEPTLLGFAEADLSAQSILADTLRCPTCQSVGLWQAEGQALQCESCRKRLAIGHDGVLEIG